MYSSYTFHESLSEAASNRMDMEDENGRTSSSSNKALFILFIVFQLIGLVGSILMLLTACISTMVRKRYWSWLSFVFSWVISCVSYSLLAGARIDWQPELPLCLTQAALIYTVPTLTASASLALVIQVLISVRVLAAATPTANTITSNVGGHTSLHKMWTFLLVFLPYFFGAGMFALSLVIGLRDRGTVTREPGGFYCNMMNPLPGKLSTAIVAVIMLICVCLGVAICVILRKNWRAFSSDVRAPLATVMRVLCFSAFSLLAIVLGILFFCMPRDSHGPGMEITLSLIPVAAVLIFGSQTDLIRSWKIGFHACFQSVNSGSKMLLDLTAVVTVQNHGQPQSRHRRTPHCGPRCSHLCNHSHSSQDSMISLDAALA
ncbi:hypothetical protein J3R30DRAFT_3421562 [Lentinula aciculospora]|uniref:Uncharacterized protein n=1 Tax=Lentinula aciculospora TaxID=153920 RepID=A0A9W9DX03_9AGAR|nr:hypothetical protein J3R30DRAFT_3421562 [Lentinula aciculospora]